MLTNKTIEHSYYRFEIKWKYDEGYADLSHLGKPTDKRGEYLVDRKLGLLLGKYVEQTFTLKYRSIPGRKMEDDPWSRYGKSPDATTRTMAEERINAQIKAASIAVYDWDGDSWYSVEWDGEAKEFYAEVSGYRILADNLGRTMGWHEYRYFDPEYIHSGEIDADVIRCAVEDWKRWEDYNKDYWCMMGCIATVYKDGVEIAESSCWGIESDGGKEYIAQMEVEELGAALHQAELSLNVKELLAQAEEESWA